MILFFKLVILLLLKRAVHWKGGAGWNLGREGQFTGEVADRFNVAFTFFLSGLCFCCLHQHIQDFFVSFYVITSVASCPRIRNVSHEPTCPAHHLFPKSKHTTKVSLEYVTNCVCVRICERECIVNDHWKKKKESTMNSKLSTFDLIIYFCVVHNFGFVQVWIFLGHGVKGHVESYHCCLFGVVHL